MEISQFHAKYYAYLLANKTARGGVEKIAATLSDSSVDLNPHQIEAALFALKSPLSSGVILADEVGLGKTIEAGLVIAQKWHEGHKRIIVIAPASLRIQWSKELSNKFYLPTVILERNFYDECTRKGVENPFIQDSIIITSYQFANLCAKQISKVNWDMAVIDEAHRLKNVYKPDSVIAKNIKNCLSNCFKVLLTATPLQNSILELYGLISFIDDYTFGDAETYRSNFINQKTEKQYDDLEKRLKKVCIRTLRKQVLEYIRYTNRIPITQEFTPNPEEQELYKKVTAYLQNDCIAISKSAKHLISTMLWKMLASSSFAIAATLEKFISRLKAMEQATLEDVEYSDEIIVKPKNQKLSVKDKDRLTNEIRQLQEIVALAKTIKSNAKGDALLYVIDKGFTKLKELGAPQKIVIFTESRRTQEYLYSLLKDKYGNSVLLYHGEMSSSERDDVETSFAEKGKILIATEAAAEGLDLQFCCCLANYDLPWNPQRIEQRIGRLHRYGQKYDVVVINLLNQGNEADKRVFEILSYKFNLFEGIFGASDSVLGIVDSVNFEQRINYIYNRCRTAEEIDAAFNALQKELDGAINDKMQDMRRKLIENFDEEVIARLKMDNEKNTKYMDKFDTIFWEVTKFALKKYATFDDKNKTFTLLKNHFYDSKHGYKRFNSEYEFSKSAPLSTRYRIKGSLAQTLLYDIMHLQYIYSGIVTFDLSGHVGKIRDLEALKGKSGSLSLYLLDIYSAYRHSELLFVGNTDDGQPLNHNQLKRLFDLSVVNDNDKFLNYKELDAINEQHEKLLSTEKDNLRSTFEMQNNDYFNEESEKLHKWADDVCQGLEKSMKELDKQISELQLSKMKAHKLADKIALEKKIGELNNKRADLRMNLYAKQDEINTKRDELIKQAEKKLEIKIKEEKLFVIRWKVV